MSYYCIMKIVLTSQIPERISETHRGPWTSLGELVVSRDGPWYSELKPGILNILALNLLSCV